MDDDWYMSVYSKQNPKKLTKGRRLKATAFLSLEKGGEADG